MPITHYDACGIPINLGDTVMISVSTNLEREPYNILVPGTVVDQTLMYVRVSINEDLIEYFARRGARNQHLIKSSLGLFIPSQCVILMEATEGFLEENTKKLLDF